MARSIEIEGHRLGVAASIGIAMFPDNAASGGA